MRVSKRWLAACLSLSFALSIVVASRKYIWLYITRTPDPRPQVADLLRDPAASNNPEILLTEAKGYTDLEINPVSAKRVWTEAQAIAHALGEREWESRAEGELGFVAFLEGDSRHAAIMVGDAFLSAKASGDTGNQVRLLEMMGNGFNEAKRYGEALAFF